MLEMLRDKMLMSTILFTSKEGPLRTNDMMSQHKIADDTARKKFIEDFKDGFYKERGHKEAEKIVRNINGGNLYYPDPIYYMDNLADQDDMMLSVAAYIIENKVPGGVLRADYLSNKYIKALNAACAFLGLPNYVNVTEEFLNQDREIIWDDPDFSQVSEDRAESIKAIRKLRDEVDEFFQKDIENTRKEITEYNAKLEKEAEKELKEEEKKKAEKEAKKAKKEAEKNKNKDTEKDEEQKAETAVATATHQDVRKPSVVNKARNRSGVTKGVSNGNSSADNSSAGNGGNGKSDDSSDSGDPDPHLRKSRIDLDEVLPPEKVCPLLEVTEDERNKLLVQADQERLAFMQQYGGLGNTGVESEAMKKIYGVASALQSGQLPDTATVQDAIDAAKAEIRQRSTLRTVNYESGRFTKAEINGRHDLTIIKEALDRACSVVSGLTTSVTPVEGEPDKYLVQIMKDGVIIDTFAAYGCKILGKGCPVLDGSVDYGNGQLGPYFVPLHSLLAVRQNIFRNIEVENIDGQLIKGASGTNVNLATGLKNTICKDYNLLDHLDLSAHVFETDEEAHAFFHVASTALNKVAEITGIEGLKLPRYRIANYKRFDTFDLFGDMYAFNNKAPYKADTFAYGKVPPDNIGPDDRRIIVAGKNITIVEPDGNTIQSELKL